MTDSSPELPPTDLLLLTPAGQVMARFAAVPLAGTSARHLTDAARAASGHEVWLLHDGGAGMGRRDFPARFEVLDGSQGSGDLVPPLPYARPWQRPDWRGAAVAWMQAQLGSQVSDLEWIHTSDVGCVLSAHSGRIGKVYLKALEDGREALAAVQIAALLPGLTPEVLAADAGRGLLLTRDAGTCLLESAELPHWLEAVRTLAQLQREAGLEGLVVHGFASLPEQADALMAPEVLGHWGLDAEQQTQIRAQVPRLLDIHRAVSALGLPECACHGDFHANNVLVQGETVLLPGETVRLFDFSEACTAHPFTDVGWFLAFIMLPARGGLKLRREQAGLGGRLWAAYLEATGIQTSVPWEDVALLALFHRAVAYDARYRRWVGTLPGFVPQYVPYFLRLTRHFSPAT